MFDWLKDFFKNNDPDDEDLESFLASPKGSAPQGGEVDSSDSELEGLDTAKIYTPEYRISDSSRVFSGGEVSSFLDKQKMKIEALSQRYANGELNKDQYESLLKHYQEKIQKLEDMIEDHNGELLKRRNLPEGQTLIIRRAHAARLTGITIYKKEPLSILKSAGDFSLDRKGILPLVNFVMRKTEEEDELPAQLEKINDQWVLVVCGFLSATVALFTAEPAKKQIQKMRELQLNFESANSNLINNPQVKIDLLVIPHQFFIGKIL